MDVFFLMFLSSFVLTFFILAVIYVCNRTSSSKKQIKSNYWGRQDMSARLKIGNLNLNMGNLSHVVGIQRTESGVNSFLKYLVYQNKFGGV